MRAAANGSTAPCAYRECSAGEFAQLRNSGNAPVLATSERTSASQPTETGKQLRDVVRSSIFYILLHGGYRPIDLVTAAMGGRRSKSATVADARSHSPPWVGGWATQSDDMDTLQVRGRRSSAVRGSRLTDLKRQEVRGGRGRTWRTRTRPCISSRTPTRRPAIAPDPRAGATTVTLKELVKYDDT